MTITTLRDVLWAFAQSLQISSFLPASLLVFVNAYIVVPQLVAVDLESAPGLITLAGCSILVSYILYAFNFPVIRFLEGYKLQEEEILQYMLARNRRHFDDLVEKLEELDLERERILNIVGHDLNSPDTVAAPEIKARWQQVILEMARIGRELDLYYPSMKAAVLPTKLGNVIRAFEGYPANRYGMDAVALWPRLVPLLKKSDYLPFVTQEKSIFDFLLNMLLVVGVLGVELVYLEVFLGQLIFAGILFLSVSLIVLILYRGLVVAARQWGTTVRVAFDLHRFHLHGQLGVEPTSSSEEDFILWQQVSSFLIYANENGGFSKFLASSTVNQNEGVNR